MTRTLLLALFLLLVTALAPAQQSDYDVQQSFEQRYLSLRHTVDSASTTGELDRLKGQIDALAVEFQDHKEFLDKALYPDTFDGRIEALRQLFNRSYTRTTTIQTQVTRITELETALSGLTGHLDTLSAERTKLFADLQTANRTLASLRETVKRLNANLQAHDRLLFSLIDSIFLPYDRNLRQASDIEKENIAGELQQANVLTRVHDVAADNVRFLQATQLQPKDYGSLIDQYQQFRSRWTGFSDKMHDVVAATGRITAGEPRAGRGKKAPADQEARDLASSAPLKVTQVDSVIHLWNGLLMTDFWLGLEKEFTGKGISIEHFTDGPSFSSSIRGLVAGYKGSGADPDPFVNEVWRERVDNEWRDALTRDSVLGKAEYASLDQAVSELGKKTVDLKLILYIAGILIIAAAVWWMLSRRGKKTAPPDSTV